MDLKLSVQSRAKRGAHTVTCELTGSLGDLVPNRLNYGYHPEKNDGIIVAHKAKAGKSGMLRFTITGDTSMGLLRQLFGPELASKLALMLYTPRREISKLPTSRRDALVDTINNDMLRTLGLV